MMVNGYYLILWNFIQIIYKKIYIFHLNFIINKFNLIILIDTNRSLLIELIGRSVNRTS